MQADKNEWPWTAFISKINDGTLGKTCGGALLNSKWVLAVKKCVSAIANSKTKTITKVEDMANEIEVRGKFPNLCKYFN